MITLAYLKSKPQAVFTVTQQAQISKDGYYPRNYSVTYNPVKDTYEVAMINLVYRTINR